MSSDVPQPSAAPGWYPDPNMPGTQRYWDGGKWTDNVAPLPPPAPTRTGFTGSSLAVVVGILIAAGVVLVVYVLYDFNRDMNCDIQDSEVARGERVSLDDQCR